MGQKAPGVHGLGPQAQDHAQRSSSVLELREVVKRYGTSLPVLGPLTAGFEPGQFTALVGASGCGKTTLLRLAAGLLTPSSGTISYNGSRVSQPPPDLGIVFQRPTLLDWFDVTHNITLQLRTRGVGTRATRAAAAQELLERVGLAGLGHRRPYELSGGQQQRVALCRALVHEPNLLLMDEPFGALDAITREKLQQDLERIWLDRRPTVLFVTHDVSEAVLLADRVIVLGGTPGAIIKDIVVDLPRPRLEHPGVLSPAALTHARMIRELVNP